MRTVVIESPYAPRFEKCYIRIIGWIVNIYRYFKSKYINWKYLNDCLYDSVVTRGESPYASHAILTRILKDRIKEERELGLKACHAWHSTADAVVFYTDLGMSPGMIIAEKFCKSIRKTVEYRSLIGWKS